MRWLSSASSAAHAQGFAVIDLETTGLSPHADRVIEVAVIQFDRDLVPYGELTTLINPGRDIGATHIHHITARQMIKSKYSLEGDSLLGKIAADCSSGRTRSDRAAS